MHLPKQFQSTAEVAAWANSIFPEEFSTLSALENLDFQTYKGLEQLYGDTTFTALPVTKFEPLDDRADVPVIGTGTMQLLANTQRGTLQAFVVRNDRVVYIGPFYKWVKSYGPTYMTGFEGNFAKDGRYPSATVIALEIEALVKYQLAVKGVSDALKGDTLFFGNFQRACRHQLERLVEYEASSNGCKSTAPSSMSNQASSPTSSVQASSLHPRHVPRHNINPKTSIDEASRLDYDFSQYYRAQEETQKAKVSKSLKEMNHVKEQDYTATREVLHHVRLDPAQVNNAAQRTSSSAEVSQCSTDISNELEIQANEINILQDQAKKLRARMTKIEALGSSSDWKNQVAHLRQKYQGMKLEHEGLEAELVTPKEKYDDLMKAYIVLRDDHRNLKAKHLSLEQAHEILEGDHITMKNKFEGMEKNIADLRKHIGLLVKGERSSTMLAKVAGERTDSYLDSLNEKFAEYEKRMAYVETQAKLAEFMRR